MNAVRPRYDRHRTDPRPAQTVFVWSVMGLVTLLFALVQLVATGTVGVALAAAGVSFGVALGSLALRRRREGR